MLGAPNGSTLPSGSSASLFVSLYNGGNSSDTLLSATAPGTAGSISLSGGTVALPANAAPVNLTGPEPEVVLENLTQPLRGGSNIPVTFDFQHAGTVTLQVPVEAQSFQWATFSPPASAPAGASGVDGDRDAGHERERDRDRERDADRDPVTRLPARLARRE